jgi:serine phosphatase RsbU (regulator of sigma subunit)
MLVYLLILFLFLSVIASVALTYKNNSLKKKLSEKEKHFTSLETERINLASEKQKLEEKNKKLFLMSETVYKEKKKVYEEIEKLRIEKEKLETEKKKVDGKIKKLWQQSTAIYREKEKVEKIKTVIEQKHREVTESITYAKRIQTAILPRIDEIRAVLSKSFILFLPRDIVSGDFYWFTVKNDKIFLAAVDCTGHGVPGALMSMVGNTLLNEIIIQMGVSEPGKILKELDNNVRFVLKQDNSETSTRDGMDICLCVFEFPSPEEIAKQEVRLQYAGANRPLWIIRKTPTSPLNPLSQGRGENEQGGIMREVEEIKGTKAAIGGLRETEVNFQTHNVLLQPGDSIYLFSDGYADLFGANDRKLMSKKFKEILLSVQNKTMQEQGKYLEEFHNNWKGNTEQTDDVLVIGVRI